MHTDNKNKDILILGKGPTQGLGDTTLTAEAKYSVNFTKVGNRSNSFLFGNATKICEFKTQKALK